MIHDAQVEVTCDGDSCRESVMIQPEYVYRSMSGAGGHYDTSNDAIESKLQSEGWTVDAGKHYCESCASTVEEP